MASVYFLCVGVRLVNDDHIGDEVDEADWVAQSEYGRSFVVGFASVNKLEAKGDVWGQLGLTPFIHFFPIFAHSLKKSAQGLILKATDEEVLVVSLSCDLVVEY